MGASGLRTSSLAFLGLPKIIHLDFAALGLIASLDALDLALVLPEIGPGLLASYRLVNGVPYAL